MAVDLTVTARLVFKHLYGSYQVKTHHYDKNGMLLFLKVCPPGNTDCI